MQDLHEEILSALTAQFIRPSRITRHGRPVRRAKSTSTRPRDSQRKKVYDAETAAFGSISPTWTSLVDVDKWVDQKFRSSVYFAKKYSGRVTTVWLRPGQGARRAFYRPGDHSVTLPLWARKEWVVCHEMAHALSYHRENAWHGWQFCETYLDVVRHVMGKEAHDRLKTEFKKRNVKFSQPRAKRQLTEEQKEVLRERMAKAREAKQLKAATQQG